MDFLLMCMTRIFLMTKITKIKKLTPIQWQAAVELLLDCVDSSQIQLIQVLNDPTNPQHHKDAVKQFDYNKMIVETIKKKIGG